MQNCFFQTPQGILAEKTILPQMHRTVISAVLGTGRARGQLWKS